MLIHKIQTAAASRFAIPNAQRRRQSAPFGRPHLAYFEYAPCPPYGASCGKPSRRARRGTRGLPFCTFLSVRIYSSFYLIPPCHYLGDDLLYAVLRTETGNNFGRFRPFFLCKKKNKICLFKKNFGYRFTTLTLIGQIENDAMLPLTVIYISMMNREDAKIGPAWRAANGSRSRADRLTVRAQS